MKKVLLAGTALISAAVISTPASAEINLDLGGFFRGYGVYSDDDSAAGNLREFDFRKHTEIHFSGETTTDAGLTVGAHYEIVLGVEDALGLDNDTTDEAYLYGSGGWGRVNFGTEDGAAYLLQVAAPSADSNVDGLRTYIQGIENTAPFAFGVLEYDHADFQNTDRLTYLSPKFSGFQAGVSYAPEAGENEIGNNLQAMNIDDNAGDYEDLWEAAARWDGEFEGFGISLGAGYSNASDEAEVAGVTDDMETWNVGANVAFQGFSLGAAYKDTNNGLANNGDTTTWVVGAGWDNGPYHVGASWLQADMEDGFHGGVLAQDFEVERFTVGGGYTYGPGMTFRGAVAFGDTDDWGVAGDGQDFTQVTVGTDVQF